ncbi:MAG: ComEC/Rec2 family competence protein [Candidatus Hydrogenedentota bacterium]
MSRIVKHFDEFLCRPLLFAFIGMISGILLNRYWGYFISFIVLTLIFIFLKLISKNKKVYLLRIISFILFIILFFTGNSLYNIYNQRLIDEKNYLFDKGYLLIQGYAEPLDNKNKFIKTQKFTHKILIEDVTHSIKPYRKYNLYCVFSKERIFNSFLKARTYKTEEIGQPLLYDRLRLFLSGKIITCIGEKEGGFVSAILFGMREFVYDDTIVFKETGLTHLLALSGLNVTIIICALFVGISGFVYDLRKRAVISIIGVILFLFQSGFCTSAERAGLMIIFYLIGMIFYKRRDEFQALSFSGLVILLFSPLELFSVGFQLTFAVTLFILLYVRLFNDILKKVLSDWLAGIISVTIPAQLASTPIIAYHFGSITYLGSFISNIIIVPFFSIILCLSTIFELLVFIPYLNLISGIILSGLVRIFYLDIAFLNEFPFTRIIDVSNFKNERWIIIWVVFLISGLFCYFLSDLLSFRRSDEKEG